MKVILTLALLLIATARAWSQPIPIAVDKTTGELLAPTNVWEVNKAQIAAALSDIFADYAKLADSNTFSGDTNVVEGVLQVLGEMFLGSALQVGGSGPSVFAQGIQDLTTSGALLAADLEGRIRPVLVGGSLLWDAASLSLMGTGGGGGGGGGGFDSRTYVWATAETTNNTPHTLLSISVPVGTSIGIDSWIQGDGEESSGAFRLSAHYRNDSGTLKPTGSVARLLDVSTNSVDAGFVVSGGNLLVQGTGVSNERLSWYAEASYIIRTNAGSGAISLAPLFLDATTNVAHVAYDIGTRLTTNWTGFALTVERSNDGATNDFYFTTGSGGHDVDIDAVVSWVGTGNTGFVYRVADQTGNGRHASGGATQRPICVLPDGPVLGPNGKLAMLFDGVNDQIQCSSNSVALPISYSAVLSFDSFANGKILLHGNGNARHCILLGPATNVLRLQNGAQSITSPAINPGTWVYMRTLVNSSSNDEIQINAGAVVVGDAGNNAIAGPWVMGHSSSCANFRLSRWVIFTTQPSGDDSEILRNLANEEFQLW